jgi:hypothetical protein
VSYAKEFPATILPAKALNEEKTYAVDWNIMALTSNIACAKSLKRTVSILARCERALSHGRPPRFLREVPHSGVRRNRRG